MLFESYLVSLGAGLTIEAAKAAFAYVEEKRPDLVAHFKTAEQAGDANEIERVFKEAVGVIDAAAGTGEIKVDNATLSAIKGIRFDHQTGRVHIKGTHVEAPILMTGGRDGATGQTEIGEKTTLKSKGTSIEVGKGCGITMTGGASIKQT